MDTTEGHPEVIAVLIAAIAVAAVLLFGVHESEGEQKFTDADKHLIEYHRTGNAEQLAQLVDVVQDERRITLDPISFESEDDAKERKAAWQALRADAEKAMIEGGYWAPLTKLYAGYNRVKPAHPDLLAKHYTGDHPVLNIIVGRYAREQGDLHAAYTHFVTAAQHDDYYASYPRGLAKHYGCNALAQIWGELSTDYEIFPGAPLDGQPIALTAREILQARIALRKGELPTIPETCALHPNALINAPTETE
ncbi:MAG: hypothetical protein AWU57_467 [Marinobacter sp. T13-3]|nr:MAG: hypothetical protein AWU57_467 [Marinobacter sp. T13-3]